MLGWEGGRALERMAPARLATPAGSRHEIDYPVDGGPTVHVRVQALFGLKAHPMAAGGAVPLTLALTSPSRPPIHTPRDLPRTSAGSWTAVSTPVPAPDPRHHLPAPPP